MWADAEAMALGYLEAALPALLGPDEPPVALATGVPDPRPPRLVRLMLSGSTRRTLVHRDSRITVECWSDDGEADASRLMEHVYAALDGWELVPPFDGWPSGPYLQPDPDTGTSRYVATCLVRHRAED